MKKAVAIAGIVSSLLLTPLANAALITQWGVHQTSNWSSALFGSGGGTQNVTASEISWGGGSGAGFGTDRSGLELTNTDVVGSILTNANDFILTTIITHHNHVIGASNAMLTSATLDTNLFLTPEIPASAGFDAGLVQFGIKFMETPNNGNCIVGSVSNCDDIFVLIAGSLISGFDMGGYHYTLTAREVGNLLHVLGDDACAAAGVSAGCLGFTTPENANTSAQFEFKIDAVEIPEPAPLALFSLGLLGLYGVSRRKNF